MTANRFSAFMQQRYRMRLEGEARMLLKSLYGPDDPGLEAEAEYRTHAAAKAAVRRGIGEEMQ
jgi:hypothetical protein